MNIRHNRFMTCIKFRCHKFDELCRWSKMVHTYVQTLFTSSSNLFKIAVVIAYASISGYLLWGGIGENGQITESHQEMTLMGVEEINSTLPERIMFSGSSWPLVYTYDNHTGMRFQISEKMMKSIGMPPRYTNLTDEMSKIFVIVTANSWTHFHESLDAVASAQKFFPNRTILYYDLGLKHHQRKMLERMCNVELRSFNMSHYNFPHFNPETIKFQVTKPLVIASALKDHPALLYLDASVRIKTSNLNKAMTMAKQNGGMTSFTGTMDSVFTTTDKSMYKYLPSDMEKLKKVPCLQSGTLLVYHTKFVFENILWWWYLCALNADCMAPPGSTLQCTGDVSWTKHRGCHRYDQSALNILMANAFNFEYSKYFSAFNVDIQRYTTKRFNVSYCENN